MRVVELLKIGNPPRQAGLAKKFDLFAFEMGGNGQGFQFFAIRQRREVFPS